MIQKGTRHFDDFMLQLVIVVKYGEINKGGINNIQNQKVEKVHVNKIRA